MAAAACAAFTSRQLSRAAGPRLPTSIYRRAFASSPFLRAPTAASNTSASSSQPSKTKNKHLKVSQPAASAITHGSLVPGSIFDEDEGVMPSPYASTDGRKPQRLTSKDTDADATNAVAGRPKVPLHERDQDNLFRALVPFPNRRARWERKMVIRSIRRRGRLTRQEEIARTERESLSKSHFFKTSVKKLMMVARQIAGKNIDDAILQMRYSPKKVAKDVKLHLELARDEAIVLHGMGLGRSQSQSQKDTTVASADADAEGETGAAGTNTTTTTTAAAAAAAATSPITIRLKTGQRKTITDRTAIYIAQAWVGRGTFGRELDYRARGNVNIMRPPYTSLTVVLKEENTRIREWEERHAKEERKRRSQLRVALPDRKVYGQRQYYSW
ncbi:mitochondrial large ribosomal subunit [Blastomyces dermatitidis ER-3]|uniref:Mitochondrial large ribosomal subunit n=1 Tax=Ajellomyces dermatitidis (strain ER-3 / ATCC MYA-2586) TaxID=559297 RepID=A0ABP2F544_AJEDR|nr:mitochondrial large ribosomal subunit [Blastomyces dermatitidis ER-3]EEQ91465.1 mitochondrial large ribosomal subunit [Blastomyces dermatitidis ER-3]